MTDQVRVPSRIAGRGRLLRSLRTLLRRVARFEVGRATTYEQARATRFADELAADYVAARSSPGARAAFEAVDRRAAVRRKTSASGPVNTAAGYSGGSRA